MASKNLLERYTTAFSIWGGLGAIVGQLMTADLPMQANLIRHHKATLDVQSHMGKPHPLAGLMYLYWQAHPERALGLVEHVALRDDVWFTHNPALNDMLDGLLTAVIEAQDAPGFDRVLRLTDDLHAQRRKNGQSPDRNSRILLEMGCLLFMRAAVRLGQVAMLDPMIDHLLRRGVLQGPRSDPTLLSYILWENKPDLLARLVERAPDTALLLQNPGSVAYDGFGATLGLHPWLVAHLHDVPLCAPVLAQVAPGVGALVVADAFQAVVANDDVNGAELRRARIEALDAILVDHDPSGGGWAHFIAGYGGQRCAAKLARAELGEAVGHQADQAGPGLRM